MNRFLMQTRFQFGHGHRDIDVHGLTHEGLNDDSRMTLVSEMG